MGKREDDTAALDADARSHRYYRNAVERHWDPAAIDLTQDVETLVTERRRTQEDDEEVTSDDFDGMKAGIAKFGAGETAVTEDLAPLSVVLEDTADQMFVTTQLYEEAKHTEFFDRYWTEVIHAVEDEFGLERSSPTDDQWFNDAYHELFERNERAMARLLEEDTPENRARAYTHYHLVIEGIAAQTGYYGMQRTFGGEYDGVPELPGLVEGFSHIRADEGRHVGFGMSQLKELIAEEDVDPAIIGETVDELLELVTGIVQHGVDDPGDEHHGVEPEELVAYATEKHAQRMTQITDVSADIPDVEELTRLDA